MKASGDMGILRRAFYFAVIFLSVFFLVHPSQAVDKYWIGEPHASWDADENWSPAGVPQDTDSAYILNSGDIVTYTNTNNPTLELVRIGAGTGSALTQSQDSLTTNYLTVGSSGVGRYDLFGVGSLIVNNNATIGWQGEGEFNQDGGDVSISGGYGALTLGGDTTGVGYYYLNDGNLTLVEFEEYIGASGSGYFNQSGGAHTFNGGMYLGTYSTGYGNYSMTGGILQAGAGRASGIVLGEWGGTGEFYQSGGTVTVDDLTLARQNLPNPSTGYYELNGGGSLTVNWESIGAAGHGIFNQIGGSHTVNNDLNVGGTGTGTYELSGGTLSAGLVRIGEWTTGTFNQTGGTNTIGSLVLAENPGSTGTYNLSDTGNLTAAWESIGDDGTGVFNQTGGTHTVTDAINVGLYSGSSGTYELTDGVLIVGGNTFISMNGTGMFIQSGGTHTIGGGLVLGQWSGSSGTYNLNGTGSLSLTYDMYIGVQGTGSFIQDGATSVEARNIFLGTDGGSGSYEQKGGSLSVTGVEVIGYNGTGTFNQSGGSNTTGVLYLGVVSGSSGTYHLSGGTLEAEHILNKGVFNYTGGSLSIITPKTFVNDGIFKLSGAGVRTVQGNVENYGTVKATDTTAVFTGTFTNEGAYISDPSVSYFNDLIVAETGYLQGAAGDCFYVVNNFINQSLQNTLWDTDKASLGFITGGDKGHDFSLAGADYGPLFSGYADNFAWGRLDLTGQTLSLYDGNATDGGAQYLGALLGAELSGGQVTNIFGNDLNIYYLASLPENAYLGGLTYQLLNGGQLAPAVPLPPAVLLLASGLAGLVGFQKRFRR